MKINNNSKELKGIVDIYNDIKYATSLRDNVQLVDHISHNKNEIMVVCGFDWDYVARFDLKSFIEKLKENKELYEEIIK